MPWLIMLIKRIIVSQLVDKVIEKVLKPKEDKHEVKEESDSGNYNIFDGETED